MKRFFLFYFIIFSIDIFATEKQNDDVYYYYYNEESAKYEFKNYKNLFTNSTEKNLNRLYRLLENRFQFKINYEIIYFTDSKKNIMYGVIVNIKTENLDLFNGPINRSFSIESVCINTLQPTEDNWGINFMIIKVNDVFVSHLDTDIQYNVVLTKTNFINDELYDFSTYPIDKMK